jgi:hypothetical protein
MIHYGGQFRVEAQNATLIAGIGIRVRIGDWSS